MLSCEDISHRISESLDRKLPLRERLGLKMHLFMCNACRQVASQMRLLHAAARHLRSAERESPSEQGTLSKEANARILEQLRNAKDRSTWL